MKEQVSKRFVELIQQGRSLAQKIRASEFSDGWVQNNELPVYQSWIVSASNLIHSITKSTNPIAKEFDKLMNHEYLKNGIEGNIFKRLLGVFESAHQEWETGMLREVEYVFAGATFDDFLDHAAFFHKGNKKIESSVLGCAVLEDTVKKICKKHNIPTSGRSLEELIDALTENETFTLVKAKRVKSFSGVRNHALHAEWDKFDISDVGSLIKGVRELISEYL